MEVDDFDFEKLPEMKQYVEMLQDEYKKRIGKLIASLNESSNPAHKPTSNFDLSFLKSDIMESLGTHCKRLKEEIGTTAGHSINSRVSEDYLSQQMEAIATQNSKEFEKLSDSLEKTKDENEILKDKLKQIEEILSPLKLSL